MGGCPRVRAARAKAAHLRDCTTVGCGGPTSCKTSIISAFCERDATSARASARSLESRSSVHDGPTKTPDDG